MAESSNFVMERDWRVEFKDTPTPGSTFDIKFYYEPQEMLNLKNAADQLEEAIIGSRTREFYWFKKSNGVQNSDINDQTIEGMSDITANDPNDISESTNGMIDGSTSTTGNGRNYVLFSGLESFSGGTAGIKFSYTVLPVQLSRFSAKAQGCEVVLGWISESELNFSHYEIERSFDGENFEQIAHVNSIGGANNAAYDFTDTEAETTNYYRLKMVDLDGSFQYSDLEVVVLECQNNKVKLYPNPVTSEAFVTLEFSDIRGEVHTMVYDINGRMIKAVSIQANEGTSIVEVDDLPAGTYLINVRYGMNNEVFKLIKN